MCLLESNPTKIHKVRNEFNPSSFLVLVEEVLRVREFLLLLEYRLRGHHGKLLEGGGRRSSGEALQCLLRSRLQILRSVLYVLLALALGRILDERGPERDVDGGERVVGRVLDLPGGEGRGAPVRAPHLGRLVQLHAEQAQGQAAQAQLQLPGEEAEAEMSEEREKGKCFFRPNLNLDKKF